MRGKVRVTIVFEMEVNSDDFLDEDLDEEEQEEYSSMDALAERVKQSYDDGDSDLIEDVANHPVDVTVEPV